MAATKLCYFRNSKVLNGLTRITEVLPSATAGNEAIIRLEQTVFYPQGGGQPSDKGTLTSQHLKFDVAKVSAQGAQVDHAGVIKEGTPEVGDEVTMQVDEALRVLHNKLHSAGHVVDAALTILGMDYLTAAKAYHYPDGPYVLYNGELKMLKEEFMTAVQAECDKLVAQDLPVYIEFANQDPDDTTCERKMRIGDILTIACGGTHVDSLSQIGKVIIRKVENKKGTVKVAYQIST